MIVCAAVLTKNGKFLICTRPPGRSHEGKWEFPGGKVRDGESDSDCLRREMMEELALDVKVQDRLHTAWHKTPDRLIELRFYSCVQGGDSNPNPLEGQSFDWAGPGEMDKYEFLPADKEFVAFLRDSMKKRQ